LKNFHFSVIKMMIRC